MARGRVLSARNSKPVRPRSASAASRHESSTVDGVEIDVEPIRDVLIQPFDGQASAMRQASGDPPGQLVPSELSPMMT
jgi:hypothetical protein